MRYPQILVYETDGRLAGLIRPLAQSSGWSLREPRRMESVLDLLQRNAFSLLVLRVGRDLEREFSLLEKVSRQHADSTVVVVLENDHPRLAGLAWDLGAAYVLTGAKARERLAELIAALMGEPL